MQTYLLRLVNYVMILKLGVTLWYAERRYVLK